MNKNRIIRIIIIVVLIALLLVSAVLYFSDQNEKSENNIYSINDNNYQDDNIKINNITIENTNGNKYLVFDVEKINKNLTNIEFNVITSYNEEEIFKENVSINDFSSLTTKNIKLKLTNFNYAVEDIKIIYNITKTDIVDNKTSPAKTG